MSRGQVRADAQRTRRQGLRSSAPKESFMPNHRTTSDRSLSGGAIGGIIFAACILILIGAFQVVAGLAAIIDDDFFVVARNYTFGLDTTAWGWIHLLFGLLLVATGFGVFASQTWAR